MALVTSICIDITGVNRFEYVVAKQGDGGGRIVQITLLNNGKIYALDNLTKARAHIIKPDKTEVLTDCTINKNVVELVLKSNILAAMGTAQVEIILSNNSTGDVLTTAEFDLKITAKNSTAAIESSTEYESLKNGLLKLDSVATKQEIEVERQRINSLLRMEEGSTTGDAELMDIRVGIDGEIYNSAGEAVRGQLGTLKDGLKQKVDYPKENVEEGKTLISDGTGGIVWGEAIKIKTNDSRLPIDEDGLFQVTAGNFYYVEFDASKIGTSWGEKICNVALYDVEKSKLITADVAFRSGKLGDYGQAYHGNKNTEVDGNCVCTIYIEDTKAAYAKCTPNDPTVSIIGIYENEIPDDYTGIEKIMGYALEATSVSDYSDKMKNVSSKYKNFKGTFHQECCSGFKITQNTAYYFISKPTYFKENNRYYKGFKGDYWIYLYEHARQIDGGIVSKGDIVYFDGEKLIPEKNPFWRNGNERQYDHYDICIVGGGSAGWACAYALKESGLKVCLVEMLDSLGGTNLNGGLPGQIASPVGDWYKPICKQAYDDCALYFERKNYSIGSDEESEFEKLWRGSMLNYSIDDLGNIAVLNPWYMREKYHDVISNGINVLYNRKVIDTYSVGKKIISATFQNTKTGGQETISAEYFVDCTADLYLLRSHKVLDVDFYIGSDGDRYNEQAYTSITPDHYEINTLEPPYIVTGLNEYGDFCKLGMVEIAKENTELPIVPGVSGKINSYHNIKPSFTDGIKTEWATRYDVKLCRIISPDIYAGLTGNSFVDYGYDYCKAIGEKHALAHYNVMQLKEMYVGTTPLLGIREGYRMSCEYMLTQKDVETLITSDNYADKNIIALSSWYADIHNPVTVNTKDVEETWINGIPYEALVPKCYTNALVACRGLGASHVAASAFRVTRTMLSIGYAAGKAVLQARENWLDDVRNINISKLQASVEILKQLNEIENVILPAHDK